MRRLTRGILVALAGLALVPAPVAASPPTAGWQLVFRDEFNAAAVDRTKWTDVSSAEADCGRGNPGNGQLEWNSYANAAVGQTAYLVITSRRQYTRSPCTGRVYGWTSALLTTRSFTFTPGFDYLEARMMLPGARGFWPAFWTWQAPGGQTWAEVDGVEYYSDAHRLYLTVHYAGRTGGCVWPIPAGFDPAHAWHVYGVEATAAGTQWYVDGHDVCLTPIAAPAPMSVTVDQAVYATVPPAATTSVARLYVDWIRVWRRVP
jgi:beta-glucanase (GH16 family)